MYSHTIVFAEFASYLGQNREIAICMQGTVQKQAWTKCFGYVLLPTLAIFPQAVVFAILGTGMPILLAVLSRIALALMFTF